MRKIILILLVVGCIQIQIMFNFAFATELDKNIDRAVSNIKVIASQIVKLGKRLQEISVDNIKQKENDVRQEAIKISQEVDKIKGEIEKLTINVKDGDKEINICKKVAEDLGKSNSLLKENIIKLNERRIQRLNEELKKVELTLVPLVNLKRDIEKLGKELKEKDFAIAENSSEESSIKARLKNISDEINQVETRLKKISGEINQVEIRLKNIPDEIIKAVIKVGSSTIPDYARQAQLKQEQSDLNTRLTSLKQEQGTLNARLVLLKPQQIALNARLGTTLKKIEELKKEKETIETKLSRLKQDEIKEEAKHPGDNINIEKIQQLISEIGQLESDINRLKREL